VCLQVLQGLLHQGKPPNDNAIVEVSLKLSVIYAAQERTEEADVGYRFCVEALEAKLNGGRRGANSQSDTDTIALLGMSTEAYARFLLARKFYAAALENLQKSLKIATDVLGDRHHQIVVLLNDIATLASLSDTTTKLASSTIRRAVSIAEQTDHAHLPILYCNLGALCSHKGDYAEARNYYGKAVTRAKRSNDRNTLEKAEEALKNLKGRV
jgi:tetratricopeptide repeat protein 19